MVRALIVRFVFSISWRFLHTQKVISTLSDHIASQEKAEYNSTIIILIFLQFMIHRISLGCEVRRKLDRIQIHNVSLWFYPISRHLVYICM